MANLNGNNPKLSECEKSGIGHDFDEMQICKRCKARLVRETVLVEREREDCDGCSSGSGYGCTANVRTCAQSELYLIKKEYITNTFIIYKNGEKSLFK